MMFEYNDEKSASNLQKHAIDFINAQALWDDDYRVEVLAKVVGTEQRKVVIGQIKGKCYTAVIHYRHGNIRIISVRRARSKEREIYGSARI